MTCRNLKCASSITHRLGEPRTNLTSIQVWAFRRRRHNLPPIHVDLCTPDLETRASAQFTRDQAVSLVAALLDALEELDQ